MSYLAADGANPMDVSVEDMAEMAGEDAPIQDFLDVLERHRIECERSGKYEEAELARTRLEQLRRHEESRRREELRSQQLAERLGVEEAHMTELQEFNEIWDRKAAEFEAHAATLQNTLAARHQAEHQEHLERLRRETEPRTPRWSKDLLNLRRIQEILAKQKKYAEAEKTKLQADRVESEEHRAWKKKREEKIESLEKQFLHKQQLEMGGLLKRIQSGREEQKQARKGELERLLQRYQNVKSQLESQQKIIQQRVERFPLTSGPQRPESRPESRSGRGGALKQF